MFKSRGNNAAICFSEFVSSQFALVNGRTGTCGDDSDRAGISAALAAGKLSASCCYLATLRWASGR